MVSRTEFRITALLALCLAPLLAAAVPPMSWTAHYEVLRNGKVMGESHFALDATRQEWKMSNHTEGTRGLAKLAGFQEASQSNGDWQDGRPRPMGFEQNMKAAFKKMHSSARYDWDAGKVHTRHEEGESQLDLPDGTVDATMMNLWLGQALERGETEWTLNQVDEDKIESVTFRLAERRRLDTALGCLDVAVVEKVRAPESTRYTRTYHAPALKHAVVQVEHGKKDGNRLETRIRSLRMNGEPVTPGPACED